MTTQIVRHMHAFQYFNMYAKINLEKLPTTIISCIKISFLKQLTNRLSYLFIVEKYLMQKSIVWFIIFSKLANV